MTVPAHLADWERWLRGVFNVGCLDQYCAPLKARCKDAEEVVKRYTNASADGRRTLDPRFFDDLQVRDESHRELFEAWFARECGAHLPEGSDTAPLADWPGGDAWTKDVLAAYGPLLCERFSSPLDIAERYSFCPSGLGQRCTLDPKFFEDLGVEDLEHRRLFSAWFELEHGSPNGGFNGKETTGGGLRTWLGQEVGIPGSTSADRYCESLLSRYPGVNEVIDAYTLSGSRLSPKLFEDANVQDLGHQRLFKRWFRNRLKPAGPARTETPEWLSWLDDVDWSVGEFSVYDPPSGPDRSRPSELVALHTIAGTGGARTLDPLFFNEFEPPISDPRHQTLILAGLERAGA